MTAEQIGRITAHTAWAQRKIRPTQIEALCAGRVAVVTLAQVHGVTPIDAMMAFERRIEWLRRPSRSVKWRAKRAAS